MAIRVRSLSKVTPNPYIEQTSSGKLRLPQLPLMSNVDMAFFVNGDELGPAHEARWAIEESQSQIGNAAGPS